MKQKRCVELHYIFLITILKHIQLPAYDHSIELLSLYTVTLSAVNGWVIWLSLWWAKEQARPIRFENFRIGQSLSNRIESDGRFQFESNLEASRVPNYITLL